MLRSIALTILVLASFDLAASQGEPASACPTISVTGPAGIPQPGDEIIFLLTIGETEQKYDLTYNWSTNVGKIVSGQGTTSIGVKWTGESGLTATVVIGGLPAGCPSTASEMSVLGCILPVPKLVGRISSRTPKNPAVAAALKEGLNPYEQIYVLHKHRVKTSAGRLVEFEKGFIAFVMKTIPELNGDRSRITIVRVEGDEEFFELWRVPPGANNPIP